MLDYLDREHDVVGENERGSLLVMVGLPGVGKSAVSNTLAPQINAVVLNTDRIRKLLYPFPKYDADESSRVYMLSELLIKRRLLRKQHVIFDATNLWASGRKRLQRIASESNATFIICELVAKQSEIQTRLEKRTPTNANYSDANWDIYQRLESEFHPIELAHIQINTAENDLAQTVSILLKYWQSIGA